jgi:hypothetical protein
MEWPSWDETGDEILHLILMVDCLHPWLNIGKIRGTNVREKSCGNHSVGDQAKLYFQNVII